MAVYTEKYPFEAPQLIKYCEIIRDLANLKPGTAWSMYDQQFRLIREDHLLPLDRIHYELWKLADSPNTSNQSSLSNFRRPQKSFGNQYNSRAFQSPVRVINNTCWTYNRKGYCRNPSCTFQHKCGYCKGTHSAIKCKPTFTQPGKPT